MKYKIIFLLSVIFFSFLPVLSQTNVPSFRSLSFFKSGSTWGSEKERYYSMRMMALGLGFQGLIEDRFTDLYRNPAYFNKNEKTTLWGDIVRTPARSKIIVYRTTLYDYSDPYNEYVDYLSPYYYPMTSNTNGLRFGYAGRFGILARGKHSMSNSTNEYSDEYRPTYSTYDYTRSFSSYNTKNSSNEGDIQFSYGVSLREDISFGASYTLYYSDSPGKYSSNSDSYSLYQRSTTIIDTGLYQSSSIQDVANNTVAHILRCGLLYEGEESKIEAIATVELASVEYLLNTVSKNNSLYMYSYSSGSSYQKQRQISNNGTFFSDAFYSDISTAKIDFRYFSFDEQERTFSAKLGVGVNFYSGDEHIKGMTDRNYQYITYYPSDPTFYSGDLRSVQYSRTAYPDGLGFFVHGGAGWGFHVKNLYLLIGGTATVAQSTFDYDDDLYQKDKRAYSTNGSILPLVTTEQNKVVHYENTFATIDVSLPVGVEYEPVENIFVRAGWVLGFIRSVDKSNSTELSYHNEYEAISTSRVSLGGGIRLFESLNADVLCLGNITEPANWQISVQYDL